MLNPDAFKFYQNPKWYKFSDTGPYFVLTKEAPKEVVESYREWVDAVCADDASILQEKMRKERYKPFYDNPYLEA